MTSANPHDGSSRHSNVALMVTGAIATDVLKTEQTVAMLSGGDTPFVVMGKMDGNKTEQQVQVLTEKAIYDAILKMLATAKSGDQIDLAMFYLSERQIIKGLILSKEKGA